MPTLARLACSACGATTGAPFFSAHSIPALVCALHPNADAARACVRGDIELVFCTACGLIENRLFRPELAVYGDGYENALHFSEFFQGYIRSFAGDLVRRHGLVGGRVLEIGCGDGSFLELLLELGVASTIGLDPSYPDDAPLQRLDGRLRVEREAWSPGRADANVDLVVCRQVLEHLTGPRGFLEELRAGLAGDRTTVCIEVPNARYTLRQNSQWDVIYEHCTYFSQGSLARLLAVAGFDVTGATETFERQFIAVEARRAGSGRGHVPAELDDLADLTVEVRRFADACQAQVEGWRNRLETLSASGRRVALWGAGARGVGFLNRVDPGGRIADVVDINPRKHGLYVAGTGQRVAPPEALRHRRPDVVVIMNPNYRLEIESALRELGLDCTVELA